MTAGFHLVVDIPIGQVPLRVAVADLFLPITVALLAWLWWRAGRPKPVWRHALVWPGLAAITVALTLSLALAWYVHGSASRWALANKYLGWFVLVGFFLAGAMAMVLLPRPATERVLRIFFLMGAAACAWSVIVYELLALSLVQRVQDIRATPLDEILGLVWGDVRMTGWLVNANSFALMAALMLVLLLPFARRGLLFGPRGHVALLALFSCALLGNGSRAAAIALPVALLGLASARELPWRVMARGLAAGALLQLVLNLVPTVVQYFGGLILVDRFQLGVMLPNSDNTWSLAVRLEGYFRAWELWLGHPWTGIGLGSFLSAEVARGANPPLVIHSTWLWLLTEAGPFGLASVAAFFLVALWSLRPRRAGGDCSWDGALAAGMYAVILLFGVMAGAHELLYQRHVWFLLGFALVCRKE